MSAGRPARGGGAPGSLERRLGPVALVLYGLGTTVGAGIYALTGEVARVAGAWAFASFALAALLAGASAASFAALSARFPRAAAEAVFVREAFARPRLATAVGLAMVGTASLSAATVGNAFVGYLGEIVAVPRAPALVALVAALAGLAAWGVRESVAAASIVTVVEVAGLALVVAAAAPEAIARAGAPGAFDLAALPAGAGGVFAGAFLAFYAFLGFEDMVNVAEEVRDAPRVVPRAIAATLAATLAIYAAVALCAVLVVPPAELAASEAPLALVLEQSGGDPRWLGAIGVVAMLNGALIQIIMASRVLFGLARDGEIPAVFGRVARRTRTPVVATGAVAVAVATLALAFPLARLAEATSLVTLAVFAVVDAAAIRLRAGREPGDPLRIPRALPWIGLVSSAGFLVARLVLAV
ncbi:MAG: APC family permease [Myxococcota bacterium]